MPDDPDVQGPLLPEEPEETSGLRVPDGTSEETDFAVLPDEPSSPLENAAREAMLQIKVDELGTQVAERDKLISDIMAERNRIKDALGETAATVGTLTMQLDELQEAYDALTQPPLSFAVIARVDPDNLTADIITDGHRHRVGVHAAIDITTLRVGQRVALNGKTMAVQQIADDLEYTGPQAQIHEWLDGSTALIEDARGEKRVVLAGDGLGPDTCEAGSDVLLAESIIVRPVSRGGRSSALGMGSRFLLAEMPDVTFDDIGGLDDELKRLVAALENPQLVPEGFAALHRKPTFSAILLGLPGNGKTMIAKAIARRQFDLHRDAILKHAKGNFFAVGGTELYSKWLGDTERFIREIIGAAQRLYQLTGATSTVFFDDCESFFLTRSVGLSTAINSSVVTQFSSLVDGVHEMKGVNLIAATNRLDLMDLAITRRFDRQVRIKPPDTAERAGAILLKHLRDIPMAGITTEEAVRKLVTDIFARTRDNELVEVFFRKAEEGEESMIVRLCDLISGKFLRDIVENAKELAIEREAAKPAAERVWALTYPDLQQSLHTELRSKESLPTTEATIADWLMQKGDKREVDYVVNLREKRRGEARRIKALDEKVV